MHEGAYPPLTPQELAAAGEALFGARWRSVLAHALDISESEIVMVESGRAPARDHWRARLVALAQDAAVRALETVNNLLWPDNKADGAADEPTYATKSRCA